MELGVNYDEFVFFFQNFSFKISIEIEIEQKKLWHSKYTNKRNKTKQQSRIKTHKKIHKTKAKIAFPGKTVHFAFDRKNVLFD